MDEYQWCNILEVFEGGGKAVYKNSTPLPQTREGVQGPIIGTSSNLRRKMDDELCHTINVELLLFHVNCCCVLKKKSIYNPWTLPTILKIDYIKTLY